MGAPLVVMIMNGDTSTSFVRDAAAPVVAVFYWPLNESQTHKQTVIFAICQSKCLPDLYANNVAQWDYAT